MLINYIKLAIRNLTNQKVYTTINVLGLSFGITACLLIAIYIFQELSYDNFHANGTKLYRVGQTSHSSEGDESEVQSPHPLGEALIQDYPEVEKMSRIYFSENDLIVYGEKRFFEDHIAFADSSFFEMFSFNLIQGNPKEVLSRKNTVVLTQSTARKYFENENPVGKTIEFNNKYSFEVTGICEDVPVNSHFNFDFLFSYSTLNGDFIGVSIIDQWGAMFGSYTYLLMPEGIDYKAFEKKASEVYTKYTTPPGGVTKSLFLQPLADIYLFSNYPEEIGPTNTVSNLYILGSIALFILIIACINFMNLTTARSIKRAREVGVRKVLGAHRFQLTRQFISESLILSIISLIISFVSVEILLPYFSELIEKKIEFSYVQNIEVTLLLVASVLAVGIVAGIYPGLFLSGYKPITVLRGVKITDQGSNAASLLRKGLVITQFVISIALIACTLIINEQLNYMTTANMGFDTRHMLIVPAYSDIDENYESIKAEIQTVSGVESVSASFSAPISEHGFGTSIYPKGRDGGERVGIRVNLIDFDYVNNYNLELIAGENISEKTVSDYSSAIVINETLSKKLGFSNPADVIGEKYDLGINRVAPPIIGVVKDFHFSSMHNKISPLVFMYWPRFYNNFNIKVASQNVSNVLAEVEKIIVKYSPDFPFTYSFLDEDIAELYKNEAQASKIVVTFSVVAVFIACLGLLGLISFSAEQRRKEIGIRKVMGADILSIVKMISKEFFVLVIAANIVAIPIVFYFMNKWLSDFAYKISIGGEIFAYSIVITILLTLITISYQAVKAAIANPVESLRDE